METDDDYSDEGGSFKVTVKLKKDSLLNLDDEQDKPPHSFTYKTFGDSTEEGLYRHVIADKQLL